MKKIITASTLGLMVLLAATGCYKVTTVNLDNSPAVTTTVSFSSNLVPIFAKNCAVSGCHGAGGQAPDLSAPNAYNSLNAGNFINKSTPANSTLYLWLTGKEAAAMPFGAPNNPSNVNALVLAWITQGAKNN